MKKLTYVSVALLLVAILVACSELRAPRVISKSEGELNALVTWDGKRFSVTNKDQFDWTYIALEINGDARVAYCYPFRRIKRKATVRVAAKEFFRVTDHKRLKLDEVEILTFIICEGDPYSIPQTLRAWRGVVYEMEEG